MAKCKVTIMNDTSLFDGHGFVHTWLILEREGEEPKYIGFTINGTDLRGAVPLDAPGRFQSREELENRPASQKISFDITDEQYDAIDKKFEEYKKNPPKYDVGPDENSWNGDFNCVTISNDILSAGGIYVLKGIQTPSGVKAKINGNDPNASIIETLFDIKDGIDHVFDQAFSWIKDIFVPHEGRSLTEAIASADVDDGASHLYASPEHGWWSLPGVLAYPHGAYSGGNGQDLSADVWALCQAGFFEKSPFDDLRTGQIAQGHSGPESGGEGELAAAYAAWAASGEARQERESSLAAAEGLLRLTTAIESGDGVAIARELVNSINTVDIAAMQRDKGSLFGGQADAVHAGLSATGDAFDLAQALHHGEGWNAVSSTAALVRDIDSFVQANGGGSFLGEQGGITLSALGSALHFGAALDGGDGFSIAASGLHLASDIGNYLDSGGTSLSPGPEAGSGLTGLSGAASAASLALDIRNLSEALESGNVKDMAVSGGHTAVSALGTYDALSKLAGGTGTTLAADLVPVVGYATSVVQLLDGDTQGAGLSAATTTGAVALSNAVSTGAASTAADDFYAALAA